MFKRMRAVTVVLAMGAGALALAPSSATATAGAAAPSISNVTISPRPIVVVDDKDVTATFSFTGKDVGNAEFQLRAPGQSGVWTPLKVESAPHGQETKFTATKTFDSKSDGRWSFLAIGHDGKGGETSKQGSFWVDVKKVRDTKIVDFDATPDLVDKGDQITVSGQLLVERGGWKGYGGQSVTITFREKGTDAYRHIVKTGTGRDGSFSAKVKAEATGWWRAEFNATSGAKGSVSDTDRVDIKARAKQSRIVGFDAYPEPVDKGDRLNLKGVLQSAGSGGWDGLRGQKVVILFKASGSHKWEYVTRDWTDAYGRFWAGATAQTSGWWKAEFAGADGVSGSASNGDWVTVNQPEPPPAEKVDSRLISFNAYPEPVKYNRYLKFRGKLQIDDGHWEGYKAQVGLYYKAKSSHKWKFIKTTWSNSSGKIYTKVKAKKSGYWKLYFRGDSDTYSDSSKRDYVRVKR